MSGYTPGTANPTTALVLSHKHPDDRDKVAATIEQITHTRGVFSGRHRIIDTAGVTHSVVVIGDQFCDDAGQVIGTHGFYLDVTPAERAREATITARLDEITERRAAIEQAKGMLMLLYHVDEDVAFDLLRWLSQSYNIKLRALAEQIILDLPATASDAITNTGAFDHALMTAHERAAAKPADQQRI